MARTRDKAMNREQFMPDRERHVRESAALSWLVPLLACLCFGAIASAQVPDQMTIDLEEKLDVLGDVLADAGSRSIPATALIAQSGVADYASIGPVPSLRTAPEWGTLAVGPGQGQRLNMRLALTMLSQSFGDEDTYRVLNAQTEPNSDALVITEGRADLATLQTLLVQNDLPYSAVGQTLTLRVPLVIWDGAILDLGSGDVLELSQSDGAFVMNFGHLRMQGAAIVAVGSPNEASRSFRPFVTTADSGTLALRGARFTGLGFGETFKFTGFSVMRSLLRAPDSPAWIEGSLFEDVLTVAVSGDDGIVVIGNQFRDMRGEALVLERTRDGAVLSNLFLGAMPTNAIRLQDGSVRGLVAGNVILGGDRTGIVVRQGGHHVTVANNVVWHRDGGGISLVSSDCGRVTGNLVIDNDQKGIEVRRSLDVQVSGNTILSNHSAGIWVSEQDAGAETVLSGNVLAFNGAGLAAARGERLLLQSNDFSAQYLQFLGGDIAAQTAHVALNMRGEVPMVLTAAGRFDSGSSGPTCTEG